MGPVLVSLFGKFSELLFAGLLLGFFPPGSSASAPAGAAVKVIRTPNPSAPLTERWKWAKTEADKQGIAKGYWSAYSIQRLMWENSTIGSVYSDPRRNRPTLREVITGTESIDDRNPSGWGNDDDGDGLNWNDDKSSRREVMKEVAVLFHFSGSGTSEPDRVRISNLNLHVEMDDEPLLWLGGASDGESLAFLKALFTSSQGSDIRKEIVTAVGLHAPSEAVFSFLRDVLNSSDAPRVREQAAFWLGQMNNDEALAVLMHAANTDRSDKVREQAVFAVSQMDGDRGLNALIKLTADESSADVQKKAAFWLGQRASEKATAALKDIVYSSKETEIQKNALFALTQCSDGKAIDDVIRIAKTHPNPKIRKEAIFWLGQIDNKRAIDALIDIVRQ